MSLLENYLLGRDIRKELDFDMMVREEMGLEKPGDVSLKRTLLLNSMSILPNIYSLASITASLVFSPWWLATMPIIEGLRYQLRKELKESMQEARVKRRDYLQKRAIKYLNTSGVEGI